MQLEWIRSIQSRLEAQGNELAKDLMLSILIAERDWNQLLEILNKLRAFDKKQEQ